MSASVTIGDGFFPCRWDWCRVSFPTLKELVGHVTMHHINLAQRETPEQIKQAQRLEAEHPFSMSEESWLASTPRPSQQVQPAWSTQQTMSQSQPLPSQPVLLTPQRASDLVPKVEPESPAPHEWADTYISLLSPTPLVAYSSRTSTPARSVSPPPITAKPMVSFAALAASTVETPPVRRLPASPTSEEQIYRQLGPDAIESDTSVSSAAQHRKRKQPPEPATPKQQQQQQRAARKSATPSGPLRRSSRHTTPVRETPRAATTTPAKKPRRKAGSGALPYASFSDAEVTSDGERERANLPAITEQEEAGEKDESPQSQSQSQPRSQSRFYTPSQSQSQLESQWVPQTQSLNLATQMPLSQDMDMYD